jgi:hypothetical protein
MGLLFQAEWEHPAVTERTKEPEHAIDVHGK